MNTMNLPKVIVIYRLPLLISSDDKFFNSLCICLISLHLDYSLNFLVIFTYNIHTDLESERKKKEGKEG